MVRWAHDGTGEAEGEGRALKAAEMAITNPLIDDYILKGAKGLLVNITEAKIKIIRG